MESSAPSQRVALIVLSSLIYGLQMIVMSPDQWYIAIQTAKHEARKAGVSAADFNKLIGKLEEARKDRFRANPLSSMF